MKKAGLALSGAALLALVYAVIRCVLKLDVPTGG